jgi:hypothetical protein
MRPINNDLQYIHLHLNVKAEISTLNYLHCSSRRIEAGRHIADQCFVVEHLVAEGVSYSENHIQLPAVTKGNVLVIIKSRCMAQMFVNDGHTCHVETCIL